MVCLYIWYANFSSCSAHALLQFTSFFCVILMFFLYYPMLFLYYTFFCSPCAIPTFSLCFPLDIPMLFQSIPLVPYLQTKPSQFTTMPVYPDSTVFQAQSGWFKPTVTQVCYAVRIFSYAVLGVILTGMLTFELNRSCERNWDIVRVTSTHWALGYSTCSTSQRGRQDTSTILLIFPTHSVVS